MLYICCRSYTGRLLAMSAVCVVFLWQLLGGQGRLVYHCLLYVNSMFVSGMDLPTSRGRGCLLLVVSVFRSASLNGVSSFI